MRTKTHKLLPRLKNSTKLIGIGVFIAITVTGGVLIKQPQQVLQAATLDELRSQSAQLQAEINANNERAKELAGQAKTLKNTIDGLNVEISKANNQIQLIDAQIAKLTIELDNAQKELDRQKDLLRASMRALYKKGGASTVELIVGSESFSDFINEQEYLERLKIAIQESTNKMIALKQQIAEQKVEQESLKQQQEAQRAILQENQRQQAELLAQTQGEEARFKSMTRQLVERQKAINRELLARSRLLVTNGSGGYPYFNAVCAATGKTNGDCWDYEWIYEGRRLDPWGYYIRNCTSYAAWRSALNGKEVPSGLGNGGQWGDRAPAYNISRGHEPREGALVSFRTAGYGHVAYVEEVLDGGSKIRISEYNFVADGVYSERILSAGDPTWYIYP